MSTLEEALKLACQKGMTHLTLYPVPSADNKTTYWNARATPSTGHSYVQIATLDPVDAVLQVLKALPSAKKRVTAKVTRDDDHRMPIPGIEPSTPEQETMQTWLPKA